jgi:hypothetical protein
MQFLKQLWASIKSSPIFVTTSSAAVGAVVSAVQDELASGKIDWTRAGLNKLTGYALTAAIAALVHLYRPAPGTNPNATKQ